MANIMKDVAKALGVELEEEFEIDDYGKYKLTKDGLVHWSNVNQDWVNSGIFNDLLKGDVKIVKPILTEKEREYLVNVIKPFRDRITVIKKCRFDYSQDEYISMSVKYYSGTGGETIKLPIFKEGTMYKELESNKCYTLEELGL